MSRGTDIAGLEDYLAEFGGGWRGGSLQRGAAALGAGLSPAAARIITAPNVQKTIDDAQVDARMWTFDQRWYDPSRYRDVRICVRQPNFGGPWVTENTQYLYDNAFVCHGWRGAGSSDGAGISLLSMLTYWSIPCNAEARENAFQYARYRWAQDRLRVLTSAGAIPREPQAQLEWMSEVGGLRLAAQVATNVRTDGDFWRRMYPAANELPRQPGVFRVDPFEQRVFGAGSMMEWLPFPGAPDRFPGRLFPVVPVGLNRRAFCPPLRMRTSMPSFTSHDARRVDLTGEDQSILYRLGIGLLDPDEGLRRYAAAGAGRDVIEVPLSFGVARIPTLEYYVRQTSSADAILSKTYFDWIKVALEYFRDRMTAHWSGQTMSPEQAQALRLIQEGVVITAEAQATMSANNAWSSLSTVLGLITMVATAVNAAVGAVVAVVAALLVTGLQELSKATGYGVVEKLQEFTDPWPPFVRIMEQPCEMPVTAEQARSVVGVLNPALLRRVDLLPRQTAALQRAVGSKVGGGTAAGGTAVKGSGDGGGLLIGAAALLLLSRLVRR